MSPAATLGAELRFRPDDAGRWRDALAVVLDAFVGARPAAVSYLTDPGQKVPRPWSDAELDALGAALAGPPTRSFSLEYEDEAVFAVVARREGQVMVSLRVHPPADPVGWLRAGLETLEPVARPEMAMLVDPLSPDGERSVEGLTGLTAMPPVLYLSGPALTVAGGEERLQAAPGETIPMAGGVALAVRDPLAEPQAGAPAQAEAAEALGISPQLPLASA